MTTVHKMGSTTELQTQRCKHEEPGCEKKDDSTVKRSPDLKTTGVFHKIKEELSKKCLSITDKLKWSRDKDDLPHTSKNNHHEADSLLRGSSTKVEKTDKTASNLEFIFDKYTRVRGKPKFLEIRCGRCNHHIMTYQKDGPGRLLRCYLDRIRLPEGLQKDQDKILRDWKARKIEVRNISPLHCPCCHVTIGFPMIYRKETRLAYNLIQRSVYF